MIHFPKNWAAKQNSFTTDPFVFSHHIYLTARGERASKETVMHTAHNIFIVAFETSSTTHSKPMMLTGSGKVLSSIKRAYIISKVLY